jgi:hypothetical protein
MTQTDPLQPQFPPVGLSREERRDWEIREGQRIAWEQDQRTPPGWRVLLSTEPSGLSRAGRKAWRKADRANRERRVSQEAAQEQDNRAAGAFVLLLIVAAGVAAYIVFGTHRQEQLSPTAGGLGSGDSSTTYVEQDPHTMKDPEYVALAWLSRTCGSSDEDPAPARLARNKDLMTPSAYAALSKEIPPVGWTCIYNMTSVLPGQTNPDDQIVTLFGRIVPKDGSASHPLNQQRHMIRQPDGSWLVGDLVASG